MYCLNSILIYSCLCKKKLKKREINYFIFFKKIILFSYLLLIYLSLFFFFSQNCLPYSIFFRQSINSLWKNSFGKKILLEFNWNKFLEYEFGFYNGV
jgi:hypothetical protein